MGQITSARFFELVDIYGANPKRWPEAERSDARHFAESNDEAGAYLAQAKDLDELIGDGEPVRPSQALQQAIMADAREVLAPKPEAEAAAIGGWLSGLWQSLLTPIAVPATAVWLLAGAIGLATGVAVSLPQVSDEDVIAFYGEESDFWVEELDPDTIELNGDGT